MYTNEDAEIIPAHARHVVHDVLGRLVVKDTPPDANGREWLELAALGKDLPLALADAIDDCNPLIGLLAAWTLLKPAETNGPSAPRHQTSNDRANAFLTVAVKEEHPKETLYTLVLLSNGGVPRESIPFLTCHDSSAPAATVA